MKKETTNLKKRFQKHRLLILLTLFSVIIGLVFFIIVYQLPERSTDTSYTNDEQGIEQLEIYKDSHIKTIEEQILSLSKNSMVIEAMKEFNSNFGTITEDVTTLNPNTSLFNIEKNNINKEQRSGFLSSWISETNKVYPPNISNNISEFSNYSATYNKYHPVLNAYSKKFGYTDVALIEPNMNYVLYTSNGIDYLGHSFNSDPLKNTCLAKLIDRVTISGYAKRIAKTELNDTTCTELYFAASIIDNNELIGILLFRYPINNKMQNNKPHKPGKNRQINYLSLLY